MIIIHIICIYIKNICGVFVLDFNIDYQKLSLLTRSNIFLEKTKKEASKYSEERKLLLKLSSDENVNCEIWAQKLKEFEEMLDN